MAGNLGEINVNVTADTSDFESGMDKVKTQTQDVEDQVGRSASGITGKLAGIGESMYGVGKSLSTSITLPLTAIGALSVKEFLEFDTALTKTQAVTGMTAEEIAAMGEAAKTMAADSVFSATEVANGMYWLADGTTTAAEIQDYLAGAMDLATASGSDLGETAQVLQGLMKAYGIDASEAGRVTDILTVAFQNSLWTGTEFNTAMSYVAASASQMGIPLEQTAAALDVMSRAGYEASTAGAGLRAGLVSLVNPTKEAVETLDKYGLTADDVNPQVVGLDTALQNLHDANISAADSAKIFTTESMGQMMSVIQASDGDFKTLIENMQNSGGAAAEAAGIVEDSASGQWATFMNDMKTLAIEIGTSLVPVLKDLMSTVKPIIQAFTDLPEPVKKIIVIVGIVAAAIGPLLMGLGSLLMIIPMLTTEFTIFGVTMTAMSAIPIVLIIVAIVAALWLLYDNWDLVWSYIEPIWNAIKAVGEAIFNGLKAFFEGVWNTISAIWNAVWGGIKAVVDFVWNAIKQGIEMYLNIIRTIIETVLNIIKGIIEFVWNGIRASIEFVMGIIRAVFEAAWNGIRIVIDVAMAIIKALIIDPMNTIKNTITNILNGIKGVFESIFNAIKGVVKGAIDFIMGLIQPVIDLVNGLSDAVGSLIPEGDVIPGLHLFARGGYVDQPTLGVFGEAGPEWLIPDDIMQHILDLRSQGISAMGAAASYGGIEVGSLSGGLADLVPSSVSGGNISRSTAIGTINLNMGTPSNPRAFAKDLWKELKLMGLTG